jgi:hypothetical protein
MRKKFVSNLAKNNNYKKSNFVKYQNIIQFQFGKKIIIRKKETKLVKFQFCKKKSNFVKNYRI